MEIFQNHYFLSTYSLIPGNGGNNGKSGKSGNEYCRLSGSDED